MCSEGRGRPVSRRPAAPKGTPPPQKKKKSVASEGSTESEDTTNTNRGPGPRGNTVPEGRGGSTQRNREPGRRQGA
jgi:hypothetical protein